MISVPDVPGTGLSAHCLFPPRHSPVRPACSSTHLADVETEIQRKYTQKVTELKFEPTCLRCGLDPSFIFFIRKLDGDTLVRILLKVKYRDLGEALAQCPVSVGNH